MIAGPRRMLAVVVLASACATSGGDEDPAAESETSETETGEESMDGHGTVRIEVSPLAGDASIFEGTTEVVATVHYESCLQDFYLQTNPAFQQDGTDGAPVFDAWLAKLCADFTGSPACTVAQIEQNLLPDNGVFNLSVIYTIEDPATLADSEIHVGPLPTSELAGCEPSVEVQQSGIIGRNAEGVIIWRISTLPADNTAETDQGAPLRVEVIEQLP